MHERGQASCVPGILTPQPSSSRCPHPSPRALLQVGVKGRGDVVVMGRGNRGEAGVCVNVMCGGERPGVGKWGGGITAVMYSGVPGILTPPTLILPLPPPPSPLARPTCTRLQRDCDPRERWWPCIVQVGGGYGAVLCRHVGWAWTSTCAVVSWLSHYAGVCHVVPGREPAQ